MHYGALVEVLAARDKTTQIKLMLLLVNEAIVGWMLELLFFFPVSFFCFVSSCNVMFSVVSGDSYLIYICICICMMGEQLCSFLTLL